MLKSFPGETVRAIRLTLVFALFTGLVYGVGMTGIIQVLFNSQANGSLITQNGQVVGSKLIGQWFDPNDARYFHPRPSATVDPSTGQPLPYAANNSAGSNYGPTNQNLISRVQAQVQQILTVEKNITNGVPVDMVTTDFSGLDPNISVANADIQAQRVAAVRGISPAKMQALVDKYTQGRFFGIFGEPCVNVLEINLALDNGEAG
ncbi:MAG: potassium-transporting ATPase subunit KdpC [Candidatus Dormibacterales bacterium]